MSATLVGTYWQNPKDGRIANVVDESWSIGGRAGRILTVVYGPEFKPSILPSTIFMTDFMADFEPYIEQTQTDEGITLK